MSGIRYFLQPSSAASGESDLYRRESHSCYRAEHLTGANRIRSNKRYRAQARPRFHEHDLERLACVAKKLNRCDRAARTAANDRNDIGLWRSG
jgi:hypothetical protein